MITFQRAVTWGLPVWYTWKLLSQSPSVPLTELPGDGMTHARGIMVICLTLLRALFRLTLEVIRRHTTAPTQMQLMRLMLENPVSSRENKVLL